MRDLTGQTFGYLTAIEPTNARIRRCVVWRCACSCAKNTCPKFILTHTHSLISGNTTSCIKQQHDKSIHQAIRSYFTLTRGNAYRRNYVFELTLEQFITIIRQSCKYCNSRSDIKRMSCDQMHWNLRANGIDRWYNNIGYIFENCVPCCARCNRAKDTMSGYEYIDHCRNVVKNNE